MTEGVSIFDPEGKTARVQMHKAQLAQLDQQRWQQEMALTMAQAQTRALLESAEVTPDEVAQAKKTEQRCRVAILSLDAQIGALRQLRIE